MRLIDADEFKQQIAAVTIRDNLISEKRNAICELIDRQPTAYDLDKILEDLEEYAYSEGLCFRNHGCPYVGNEKIDCGNCAAIGALEIVKGGGYAV